MTPILLKLSGVFSYQNPCTIDFKKLSSQGIFGIFGDVGSGKSAIIDAMTFVLFGDYHRSPNKNIYYNLMNLKSNESLIEFTFEHNEFTYFFQYNAKRSKSNFQNITSQSRKAYQYEDGQLIPLQSNNGALILDLEFEEFIKLVIIPQGQFAEFINLTDGNRTKMLKKILKLDKYSLHAPTSKLLQTEKIAISHTEGQLLPLTEVNQEIISQKNSSIEALKIENDNLELKIKELDNLSKEKEVLKSQISEYTRWQENLEKTNIENIKILELEKKLKIHQQVHAQFKTLYIERKSLLNQHQSIENQLNILEAEIEKSSQHSTQLKAELQHILKDHKDTEGLKLEQDKILIINSIKTILLKQKSLIDRQNINNNQLLQHKEKLISKKIELEATHDHMNKLNNILLQESHIKEQKHYYTQIKKLQQQLIKLNNEKTYAELELEKFGSKKNETLDKLHKTHSINIDKHQKITLNINSLQERKTECLKIKHQLEIQYAEISQISALQHFAQHLHIDQPCPLCGAINHPKPFDNKDIEHRTTSIQESVNQTNRKIEDISLCIKDLENLIELYKIKSTELTKINTEILGIKNELNSYEKLIDNQLTETNLESILSTIQQAQQEIISLNNIKTNCVSEIKNLESLINSLIEADFSSQISKQQGEIDSLMNSHGITAEDISNYSEIFAEEIKKRLTQALSIEKSIKDIAESLNTLQVQFDLQTSQNNEIIEKINVANTLWSSKINNYNLQESEIIHLLEEEFDTNNVLERIKEHQTKTNNILFKINELQNLIKDRKYDEAEHFNILNQLKEAKEKSESTSKTLHQLTNECNRLQSQLKIKAELIEIHKKQDNRIKILETLLGLFRGEKFVEYISKKYTQHLFILANKRFKKLTLNQLELSLDSDSNFSIIDYMNDKRPRSIKTLSGGQLFQASLCLALALSEQLQLIQNQHQQFFFIDEGFGTLDKDSLNIVLETLKELKKEGRTVGIISHVEELRQDIDLNIQVKKDAITGSHIQLNY